ncbi:DUF6701 domain-containing protein [Duganella aceris]|uniref:DUF11 domain-containing protein n=1 Tax=Duganella aceris TaxID=2703883 RepID=A0ABX0FJA2_9BURK|nr:DUF6701 domain-containing protein [Duganella aceris]NGZ84601.1 hypothetical protein [Duganella aceris]
MTRPTLPKVLPLLLALLCWLVAGAARADSPITLFKSFAGNVSFTGTQKTLRTASNASNPCSIGSSVTMQLRGIPSGAAILNAQLYWAGSSSTPDYAVTFDGTAVSAPSNRRYTTNSVGYDFFSGAVDVTAQVQAKGNADYTAGDLTINSGAPYCAVEGVLGGFQLLVVYSQSNETFRVLNLYEGFQYIRSSGVTLTLSNFKIPTPIGSLTGKIGHITWEGDSSLSGGGEILQYNGVEMTDALNPSGNQFNSISNINNDSASYGIDFDAYTVSSPTIQAGQTSARSDYKSGSDLVLMNAEVIAAPNVPAADRAISMTLSSPLVPSQNSNYLISVSNNGPLTEGGPVTVAVALPSALIYAGATGTGWSCSPAGQTIMCTYSGSMAANTTLPLITLRVTVAAAANGLVTTSAAVGGALFDYYDGNDTSTVSSQIGAAAFTPSYYFTDSKCVNAEPFYSAAQTCKPIDFTGQQYLANKDIEMYLTFVVGNVPTALSNSDTTLKIKYALSCYDPAQDAGVRATFKTKSSGAVTTLPLCAKSGALPAQSSSVWSGLTDVLIKAGQTTSDEVYLFHYADVGRIEFLTSDNTARLGTSGPFVERPVQLTLSGPAANKAGSPAAITDPVFVTAGTSFQMSVIALMYGLPALPAPNFGKESSPVQIKLTPLPARDSSGSRFADMMVDPAAPDAELTLAGTLGAFSGGIASGSFVYADVGTLEVTAAIMPPAPGVKGSYLGTGDIQNAVLNIGRFVPDHFDTVITTPPMTCDPAGMTCPANAPGMAYSGQSFTVQVLPRNTLSKTTLNYRGIFARGVTLSAYSAPGTTTTVNPPASPSGSVLSANSIASSAFVRSADGASLGPTAPPVYTFPRMFSGTAPFANNWVTPTAIYLRATETSSPNDGVTSLRSSPVEAGIMIVTGRMLVPNAYGSSQLPLLLNLSAQYYGQTVVNGVTTAAWRTNAADSVTKVTPSSGMLFSSCALACPTILDGAERTLAAGAAKVSLKAGSTTGKSGGSAVLNPWPYLPSTIGRVTFGVYRSPLIFLREVY